jgi:hypothetical protein
VNPNNMSAVPIDTASDRLHEFIAYQQPVLITQTSDTPWVFLPQEQYNLLLSAAHVCDILNEQHRQQHEPLPPITVS